MSLILSVSQALNPVIGCKTQPGPSSAEQTVLRSPSVPDCVCHPSAAVAKRLWTPFGILGSLVLHFSVEFSAQEYDDRR